ncbi:hypothetical protein AB0C60_28250, partial [Streptomyces sp. NPDC048845]
MRNDEKPGSVMTGGDLGEIGSLVRRAADGDERATDDLLAFVHPLALRYCRTRLGAHLAHLLDEADARVDEEGDPGDDVAELLRR